MKNQLSAGWTIVAAFLCYLAGNLLLTHLVTSNATGGILFAYPLYAVTRLRGKRNGFNAAVAGLGLNFAIWLLAGNAMETMHRVGVFSVTALFVVECFASVVFVLMVSGTKQREDHSRREIRRSGDLLGLSEEKYRVLVDAVPEAMFVVEDGKVRFFNDHALELSGNSREEMTGISMTSLVHEDDRGRAGDLYAARLQGRSVPKTVLRIATRNRDALWVETIGQLIEWEGRPAVLYFASDITERRKLEEQFAQSQKLEAIGRLAGGIAHDFNNLLQVILGYSALARSNPDDRDAILNNLRVIEESGLHAASLTRQLLAFSRKQVVQATVIDLAEHVLHSKKMLSRVIGEDVVLRVVQGSDACCVLADEGQLQQVIMNLALNARDAMPGGGRISIAIDRTLIGEETEHRLPPGDYVRLAVSDTGSGMDTGTIGHLFEPFFSTKPLGKGTGLGLSIVHGIVKQGGGHIRVDSTVGRGSTFTIYLPRVPAAPHIDTEELNEAGRHGAGSILLVEDEAPVRSLIGKVLSEGGYTVTEAASGVEAITACRARGSGFDLLLTDNVLTETRGRDVADSVRLLFPGVKVIYMSGYAEKSDSADQERVPFLQKPFTSAELLTQVNKSLFPPGPG